jgi:hypothetical protein
MVLRAANDLPQFGMQLNSGALAYLAEQFLRDNYTIILGLLSVS